LLLRLLDRRFDEAERRRVDFVLGAFVFDVGGGGEQRQGALEVDLFAVDLARCRRLHVQLRQLALGAALERPGGVDVDVATFLAGCFGGGGEFEVAALDALKGRFVQPRLRALAALVAAAAAAGGKRDRQGQDGGQGAKESKSAQGGCLL